MGRREEEGGEVGEESWGGTVLICMFRSTGRFPGTSTTAPWGPRGRFGPSPAEVPLGSSMVGVG